MYLPKDPHMQNFGSIGLLGAELQTLPCQQDVQKTGLCCPPFIFEGLHPWLNCLFTAAPRMGGWWLIFCCKKILKLFINFICDMVSIVCGGAGSGLGGRGARLALVPWCLRLAGPGRGCPSLTGGGQCNSLNLVLGDSQSQHSDQRLCDSSNVNSRQC